MGTPLPKLTLDDYLRWENEQPDKHEFYRGELFAMVGGRRVHGRVISNLNALLNIVIASPSMKYRAPFILNMPDDVWFNVDMMMKDILLALEMGETLGVPLRTAQLTYDVLKEAQAMGYGEEDFAALFKVVAHTAGMVEG